MQAALEARIIQENWEEAVRNASNLSELCLTLGDFAKALHCADQSCALADRSGDASYKWAARGRLALLHHQAGNIAESEFTFSEAETILKKSNPIVNFLYSDVGFHYCDLFLSQGNVQNVLSRAEQTLKYESGGWYSLLSIALDHLSLGRAYLQQVRQKKTNEFTAAVTHLRQAVDGLRQAGHQEFLSRGLLARAELHRVVGDFAKAQRDLDEAFKIATRGGMRLHEADCHLEYARLHLAMGEKDKAQESWAKAKKMIEEMGYHRRDPEIHLIEAQLHLSSGEKDKARESLAKAKELIDKMGMHRWDVEVEKLEKVISAQ